MTARVVEVARDGAHLGLSRGFLVIRHGGKESGRVALDEISVVLAHAHGITFSANLVGALAERGVGLVICGSNHAPVATMTPAIGHHAQARVIERQIGASQPLRKQLWRRVVQAKILWQAEVAKRLGAKSEGIAALAPRVRSGDPDNREAQAARRYWPLVLGREFRRDPGGADPNGLLNYGYAILRSAVARSVVAAGLHPSIGIHHRHPHNPFCLADDLLEPFRPLVDFAVVKLGRGGGHSVTPGTKAHIASIVARDLASPAGRRPVDTCVRRAAISLAQSFAEGEVRLELPEPPLPDDWDAIGKD